MSSRQEEKARRRAERMKAEEAAKKAEARRKRMGTILGGALSVGAVVAVVVLIASGGGGDGGSGDSDQFTAHSPKQIVDLPAAQFRKDLPGAAKAAGCTLTENEDEGDDHTEDPTQWVYKANPPTSGPHNPVPADEGVYNPGDEPTIGFTVHALEHGRIELQYRRGASKKIRDQLESLASNNGGYHMLVFQNQTDMKAEVAATAWNQSLTCPKMNDRVFDAMREFRDQFTDKGPEFVP